jgi:DNA-binding GntR family transcriptional regulator
MIFSGKFKKGQRYLREEIAQLFDVSEMLVAIVFSQLKKDGLIIIKSGVGSFVKFREGKGRARNSPTLFLGLVPINQIERN